MQSYNMLIYLRLTIPLLTDARGRGVLRSDGGRGVRCGGRGPIGGRGGGLGLISCLLLVVTL